MVRIAILNAGHMDYGGTERVVAFQARGFHARGHRVSIFTPVYDRKIFDNILPREISVKAWWHMLPTPLLKRTINRLLHFWLGGEELKKFDILIAHNQPAPYVSYKNKKKNKKPYVIYCHAPWRRLYPREIDLTSGWASDFKEKIMFLREDYWRRIDKEAILGANAILVNSLKIRGEVKKIYGRVAQLCYPGIEVVKYREFSKNEVDDVVKKYCINDATLLVVGRHAPQKRLEWIPTIVNKVKMKISKVKIIVTGKPNRHITPKLIETAKRLKVEDRIQMVGAISEKELTALYHSCPVLVYNAVYEDLGLPPIEAMACGCVPVAWNEGAGPCETIVHKKTGLLAKPYDLHDFADKVTFLLENPSKRAWMAKKGIANAMKYDWSTHISILEEVISRVIE